MSSATTEIKYDITPANPDPGDDYDNFRERALNAMSVSDERGWSLAPGAGGKRALVRLAEACGDADSTKNPHDRAKEHSAFF